jgi:hypothetical protein
MAQHMISKQSDGTYSILHGSTVVDDEFETLQEAQDALDELENDDSEEADDNRSSDWKVEARKKLDSVDPTLEGHATPDEWLKAARARSEAVEAEMRMSSLPASHLMSVSSLNEVETRSL